MRLSELLREDVVLLGFQAADPADAITRLVDHLVHAGRIPAERRQAALDAALAREKCHGNGLENGIALPHARVDFLPDAVAALAIAPAGVPFQTPDGQPARVIALYFIPPKSVATYIRLVARMARLFSHTALRDALIVAPTPAEVLALIRREEEKDATSLAGT